MIASGRNGGAWDGSGIVTSQSSATQSILTSIGVTTAAQATGVDATATGTWAGQTVTGSDALVMYTYGGDANLDGKIDIPHYRIIDIYLPLQGAKFPTAVAGAMAAVVAVPEPAAGVQVEMQSLWAL